VDGKASMKRIESKNMNLRLVSSRGKAKDAAEGSIYFFYKRVFNEMFGLDEMLDLERKCFQHLLEEEDTLFAIQNWEGKKRW
jgi:hypothetical protein